MGSIFVYSLIAAANASLLAAVTVMLFLPNPKRLLLGYLLGGLLVSLTIGFLIVFVVHHSGATSTTQDSVSPATDIALGLLLLVAAYVRHRFDARNPPCPASSSGSPTLSRSGSTSPRSGG